MVGPHRCWSHVDQQNKNSPCISTIVSGGTITKTSKRDNVRSLFLQWRELGLVLVTTELRRWSIPLTKWQEKTMRLAIAELDFIHVLSNGFIAELAKLLFV